MHSARHYLDFRILFPPLFEHEIQIGFTIRISLEEKIGAIVSWVLEHLSSKMIRGLSSFFSTQLDAALPVLGAHLFLEELFPNAYK